MARSKHPHKHRHKRRRHYTIRRGSAPGAAPGTLAVDPNAVATQIDVIAYGPEGSIDERAVGVDRLPDLLDEWPVTWINVTGLADHGVLERIAAIVNLHPLALEDVVNVHQRAKVEEYDGMLFVVARMVMNGDDIRSEQLSIAVGKSFVVTFQERPGDVLDPVRDRIRGGRRILHASADYLMYSIVDAVIDNYFPVLEDYGERLEELEEQVITRPPEDALTRIHTVKHDLLLLRRAIWPQRDALGLLHREPIPLVTSDTRIYLRDTYDHTIQIIDLVEGYRELASSLLEIYLSSLSHRMNETMKVLTIFASTFIPLSFIAGLYGMNFDPRVSPWNMPELDWRLGYPFALGLMAATAGLTLGYFRHKGWIGGSSPLEQPAPSRDKES